MVAHSFLTRRCYVIAAATILIISHVKLVDSFTIQTITSSSPLRVQRQEKQRQPSSSCLNLFFFEREKEITSGIKTTTTTIQSGIKKRKRRNGSKIPSQILQELRDPAALELPFTFQERASNNNDNNIATIVVRHLEIRDIEEVVPMCVREFATPRTAFPWRQVFLELDLDALDTWFDALLFAPLVWTSLCQKVWRQQWGDQNNNNVLPDNNILVLELQQQQQQRKVIVGVVELSREPIDPERNPGPFTMPLWSKHLYAQMKQCPPPNGWITNLLIDPNFRSRGYSKILMAAVEGLAKQWQCSSLTLHVDSCYSHHQSDKNKDEDYNGYIPQSLYTSLGFRPLILSRRQQEHYDIIDEEDSAMLSRPGVYNVDGVFLLCLQKQLH